MGKTIVYLLEHLVISCCEGAQAHSIFTLPSAICLPKIYTELNAGI
jgi:hypothetical protein